MLSARCCCPLGACCIRLISTATPLCNHYETLGIDRSANAKQIKAAYYELSKQYHPDTQQESKDKQSAALKFQEVASAYEVLGSEDKRREYDATFTRRSVTPTGGRGRSSAGYNTQNGRQRVYTDLDIDYKNFEHFQRSTRRRRSRHDHWQMPDEFFNEFGGKSFKSEYQPRADHQSAQYKDGPAAQREQEEAKRMEEIEEERKRNSHPIPSFEQLYRQQQERKAEEQMRSGTVAAAIAAVAAIVLLLIRRS